MGLENFECRHFIYEEIEHLHTNFLLELYSGYKSDALKFLNPDPDMRPCCTNL